MATQTGTATLRSTFVASFPVLGEDVRAAKVEQLDAMFEGAQEPVGLQGARAEELGGSVLLRYSVDNATQQWQGGIEFIVFMNPDASQDQIDLIQKVMEAMLQMGKIEVDELRRAADAA